MNLTRLAHARPFITRQLVRLPFSLLFFLFNPERGLVVFPR